ncbi:MAG: hypothetical protein QY321_01160 [Patescibacteria group bacterium]|nr:MAG: hypothetical protein QY321_01160 [Patescibacteria group bacterium]
MFEKINNLFGNNKQEQGSFEREAVTERILNKHGKELFSNFAEMDKKRREAMDSI